MVRYCLCVLAGAYALHLADRLPPDFLLCGLGIVAIACHGRRQHRALGGFLVGLVAISMASRGVVQQRLDHKLEGRTHSIVGVVSGFPEWRGDTLRFEFMPMRGSGLPSRIRLSWYRARAMPGLGDTWRLDVRLRRPRGFSNPGGFDYEGWLFRNRIGATGYVVEGDGNAKQDDPPPDAVPGFRRRVSERVSALLPEDDASAVLLAITVGARHRITREQWGRYAATGTSHLIAISGLHVGLAAGGVFVLSWFLVAGLTRCSNARDPALAAAAIAAGGYALLSGLAVPAQRALTMAVLFGAAGLARRHVAPIHVLALGCLLIVAAEPLATLAPGFKLSFAAVAWLLWHAQHLLSTGRVTQLWSVQIVLLSGLFPLTALIFGRASIVAPMVNMLVLPVFGLVTVPAGLAGVLLGGPLQPAGDSLLQLAYYSIVLVLAIIRNATEIPGVPIEIVALRGPMIVVAVLPALWALAPRGWPGRHLAWVAMLAVILHRPPSTPAACIDIDVLDVGQGLAVVLRTANRTAVFDTGPSFRGGSDTAELVLVPFLKERGIDRLDLLVVSHADLDHAGGVDSLMAHLPVSRVIAGEPLDGGLSPGSRCVAGDEWTWDGIHFEVLHPRRDSGWSGNNASCVLQIGAGDERALLTGDIESPVETALLHRGLLQPVALVVIPHHGSRTSSGPAFVDALEPRLAIVSTGYRNRWGFPKQEVVARWRNAGATVLKTYDSGAISRRICVDGSASEVREHRRREASFWTDAPERP